MRITRRGSLALAGAMTGLGAPFLPRRAAAADMSVEVIRAGVTLTTTSHMGYALKIFTEEVAARTDGRLRVETYGSGELGDEAPMLASLRLGSIHASMLGPTLAMVDPLADIFMVPFLFRDAGHARRVLDGPFGAELSARLEAGGVIALAWAENGMRHITSNAGPIRSPADLKGLKLRVQPSETQAIGFRAMGAEPAPLPFGQLYEALLSGRVDGQENPTGVILGAQLARVQKHIALTGHIYAPMLIAMSPAFFHTLSPADQTILREAAVVAAGKQRIYVTNAENADVAALRNAGMTVTTDIDRAAFERAASSAETEFARRFGAERLAAIRAAQ